MQATNGYRSSHANADVTVLEWSKPATLSVTCRCCIGPLTGWQQLPHAVHCVWMDRSGGPGG